MTAPVLSHTLVNGLTLLSVSFVSSFTAAVALLGKRRKQDLWPWLFVLLLWLLHHQQFRSDSDTCLFPWRLQVNVAGCYLSRSNIDAGGVRVAASSVRTVAVVDGLTLVPVLPPPGETLTGVTPWSCLHTFSLQGAQRGVCTELSCCSLIREGRMCNRLTFTLQPPLRGGAHGSDSTQVIPSPW